MKKLTIIAVILLGLYGCWMIKYPSGSFRYKLTLVVDDNGKQIVSSSVREVFIQVQPRLPEGTNYLAVKGEAVVVDLGEKGVFFALLKSETDNDYGYRIVFDTFPIEGPATAKGIKYYTHLKAKKELSFDKLPMLVTFHDVNDRKTVEKIVPNDLEKSIGKGIRLVSATLEMTSDNITNGKIENYLQWFEKWKEHGGTISGKETFDSPPPPETILTPRAFRQE